VATIEVPAATGAVNDVQPPRAGWRARALGAAVGAWGVITGVAPHLLHHAGPLAGAALLAGLGGQALFFALGLVLSVPMLRRLYRRFGSFRAPAVAIAVFAALFTFSSLVIAPRLSGGGSEVVLTQQGPTGVDHDAHHP
jgi:hypothetical protein